MKVFLQFVDRLQPKVVVIENVAEVWRAYDGQVSKAVVARLEKLGYTVDAGVVNAAWFGIPQLRRRVFFVASRTRQDMRLPLATHAANGIQPHLSGLVAPATTVWDAISDLPSMGDGCGTDPCNYAVPPTTHYQRALRNGDNTVHDHIARKLTSIQLRRIKHLGPGQGFKHLPDDVRPAKGYSGAYSRLIADEPARTITRWVFHPGSGRFIHPYDDRVITIREAARLQSFPDWFVFTGTYIQKSHQVGEAVPPLLARRIAERAREVLSVG
jgi:DNA (cytosine-5)-methyltransferase 1